MDNWTFYGKTIFMWSLVLILSLLDMFVPENFYRNTINEIHIFKVLSICMMLSALAGSIVCRLGWNNEKKYDTSYLDYLYSQEKRDINRAIETMKNIKNIDLKEKYKDFIK